MSLPRGVALSQLPAQDWQISWSKQHPATRWSVSFCPPGQRKVFEIGIIESTRRGAKGHNRHSWWALTPLRAEKEDGLAEPSIMDEGVFNRCNRTEAAQALVDAFWAAR